MKKLTQKQINAYCEELTQIKEYLKRKEEIENILKQQLENVESLSTKQFELKYTLYESTRLDSKKLKETLPEIYKNFSKTDISRRFSYKAI